MLPGVSDQYFDIYLMDNKQFAWNIDMHVEDFNMDLDLIRNWKEMINHNFSSCSFLFRFEKYYQMLISLSQRLQGPVLLMTEIS